jgi:hypothetical protein
LPRLRRAGEAWRTENVDADIKRILNGGPLKHEPGPWDEEFDGRGNGRAFIELRPEISCHAPVIDYSHKIAAQEGANFFVYSSLALPFCGW